ncbi:hypothetical protein LZC95_20130 [Pendulispora brunnea]|uniref:Uncharacterized protein n=1 Tax=Pendulispora brunnea TaxID=2905690 RepID=A0ABZ2KKB4_9BACT
MREGKGDIRFPERFDGRWPLATRAPSNTATTRQASSPAIHLLGGDLRSFRDPIPAPHVGHTRRASFQVGADVGLFGALERTTGSPALPLRGPQPTRPMIGRTLRKSM